MPMRKRYKEKRRTGKRKFARTASRMNKRNGSYKSMRGGTRL